MSGELSEETFVLLYSEVQEWAVERDDLPELIGELQGYHAWLDRRVKAAALLFWAQASLESPS